MVKGYSKLHPRLQERFERVHKSHLASLGTAESARHSVNCVEKVVWDSRENCLKVHFRGAGWYHYTLNGEWY